MFKVLKKITIILVIFSLLVLPAISFAESEAKTEPGQETNSKGPNAIEYTLDLLIARPIGIVLVPLGAVLYAVSYPFTALSDSEDKAYESFLGENIRYTFQRPLGEDLPL